MPTLIDSDSVGFADGNAGHLYAFPAGAPAVGDLDVIGINSDTTVSTPSGFTLPANGSRVNNQGHYVFYRFAVGGESANVTITTNGNFNTALRWSRFSGVAAFEIAAVDGVDSSAGTTTPVISTGVLSTSTMLVVADAGLHGNSAGTPQDPVWSSGYTAMESITQGLGGAAANGFSAYKTPAGTAAETPNVTWTNPQSDRYIIAVAFTSSGDGAIAPDGIAIPVTLGAPTLDGGQTVAPDGITVPVTLGAPTVNGDMAIVPDGITIPVSLGEPALSGSGDTSINPDGITIPVTLGTPTLTFAAPPSPLGVDLALAVGQFAKACLCEAVALLDPAPEHCRFQVGTEGFAGVGVDSDECCEGVAYTALGDIYPSWSSFPDADIIRQVQGRCVIQAWAVDIKLGIIRCAPTGTNTGPPTDAEWNAAALLGFADAQALRRASCCLRQGVDTISDQFNGMNVVIGRQQQGVTQGGCMERYVTITVQFPNCEAC